MAARNVQRIEINTHEKLCVKLVIYRDHKWEEFTFVLFYAINLYPANVENMVSP